MSTFAYGWRWSEFLGSEVQLNWSRRELRNLDAVVGHVTDRRAVIQAGGNLGIFPKRLAQSFETVYTFEPAAALFPLLLLNAPERNIVRFQAALGETRDLVALSQTRRDSSRSVKRQAPAHEGITHVSGPGTIPTLRIDDLALPACGLIYLDLEGWELFALRGAVETIRRCRPVVAVEINQNLSYVGVTPEQVRGFVQGLGYRFVDRLQSDEVFLPEVAA